MKTYYPAYPEIPTLLPEFNNMIANIKNSNLSDEYKFAILAKMADYESAKDIADLHIKEVILRILTEQACPMRAKDLCNVENNGMLSEVCIQRVSAHLRQLVISGLVRRTEEKTGKKIEIKPGKFIEETIAYFEIIA